MPTELIEKFEKHLAALLAQHIQLQEIFDAACYMLLSQGKRIRPRIFLSLTEDLVKGKVPSKKEDYMSLAVALELVHTATLIHDDLPALDDDDYRRGKVSCHKKFGEDVAILTGDYLTALASFVVTESQLSSDVKVRFLSELSKTFMQICSGQILDLQKDTDQSTGKSTGQNTRKDFVKINRLKTAALFKISCSMAGLVSAKDSVTVVMLEELGDLFGQYFQLRNDFQDLEFPEETGRNYSSDEKNSKINQLTGKVKAEQKRVLDVARKKFLEHLGSVESELGFDLKNFSKTVQAIL